MLGGSNDYTNFPPISRSAAHASLDAGQSWATETLTLPPNYTNSADPSVDYDSNGNAYYCFTAFNRDAQNQPKEGGIFVYKSTSNEQPGSWSNPVTSNNGAVESHLGSTTLHDDKPWMIVDRTRTPNRIYVAWTTIKSNGLGELWFSYSDNGGSSFTGLQRLRTGTADELGFLPFNHGVAMAVNPTGTNQPLYVTWVENWIKGEVVRDNNSTMFNSNNLLVDR